jgi:hypothetical protein
LEIGYRFLGQPKRRSNNTSSHKGKTRSDENSLFNQISLFGDLLHDPDRAAATARDFPRALRHKVRGRKPRGNASRNCRHCQNECETMATDSSQGGDRACSFKGGRPGSRAGVLYRDILGFALTQRYGTPGRLPFRRWLPSPHWAEHVGECRRLAATGRGDRSLIIWRLLYPTRAELADALRRPIAAGIPLEGASDHGVSEALYLRDPDGNGWSCTGTGLTSSGRGHRPANSRCLAGA